MYLTAWFIKFMAIQLMMLGILQESKHPDTSYRICILGGAILFSIGANLVAVHYKNKGGDKK